MRRHYDKAQIAEAVIDLRVELPDQFTVDAFDGLGALLFDRYPVRFPIRAIEMGFQQEAEAEARFHSAQEIVGVRLQSKSGDRVLQAQKAGFTFSHVGQYSTWEQFRGEAEAAWRVFLKVTGARRINRAAVRVINKLQLPGLEVREYTTLNPNLPPGPLQSVDAFFMQLQVPLAHLVKDCQALVNVAQGRPEGGAGSGTQLILDFDLFVTSAFDADSPDVWALLDKISEAKNDVFESSITDKTRELIS